MMPRKFRFPTDVLRRGGLWTALAFLAGGSVACSISPLEPLSPPPEEALSILFVGNSLTYANDMPSMLAGLLEEAAVGPVVVASSSFPNYGLQDHWVDARTRDSIAAGGWDYVVLQQGPSATEGRPSLLHFTARFAQEITAIGARPALYMVWPAASRGNDFDGVVESLRNGRGSGRRCSLPGRRDLAFRLEARSRGQALRRRWLPSLDPRLLRRRSDDRRPADRRRARAEP